jgi:multimeric flavodoxin WrbA
MEKSKTTMILNPFLDGMKKAGASIDLFYVKRLKIKSCTGEFHCWRENPGECYIGD